MKDLISVSVSAKKFNLGKLKTDLLAVGMFSDDKKPKRLAADINKKLDNSIEKLLSLGDFKGKEGSTAVIYTNDKIGAKRVLLVGLGDKKDFKLNSLRKAATAAANKAVDIEAKDLTLALHQNIEDQDIQKVGQAITEGAYFGSYRYDEYVSDNKKSKRKRKINIQLTDAENKVLTKLRKGIKAGSVIGEAQNYGRTIANRPGNIINPPELAKEARKMARDSKNLTCTVFTEKQLKQKKMGGILAVGSGSKSAPRLIVLKYKASKSAPTIGFVGKAVTFDSGGISIKPSKGMHEMKFDKSGGIAVLAAMKAIAGLKPKVNVTAYIPSAENMPGGSSYRPGDIIETFSGKTVEVQNTDAEGRMIMCDALAYADKQKCDRIIDIATLTGACMVALGHHKAGLMGNDTDLIEQIKASAEETGEPVWHLPSGDEYTKEMKSKIADLKNIGGRWGGACTAASFLGEFVGDRKWAHIDMAGVDLFKDGSDGLIGSTGFGVRLLTTFVMNFKK